MYQSILPRHAAALARVAQLEAQVLAYQWSHLGIGSILSGPAIRYELSQLHHPVDIIAWDWRKQNEWNAILGWNPANAYLSRAARVDWDGDERRAQPRTTDLRGQYGGDEVIWAVDVGHGRGLLARLLRELQTMNRELSSAHRAAIAQRTGGLIDGFCVAAVLVEGSTNALADAVRAVDATGALKSGNVTGDRATSGARGTVIGRMTR